MLASNRITDDHITQEKSLVIFWHIDLQFFFTYTCIVFDQKATILQIPFGNLIFI